MWILLNAGHNVKCKALTPLLIALAPAGAEGQKGAELIDGFGITGHRHQDTKDFEVLEGAYVEEFSK